MTGSAVPATMRAAVVHALGPADSIRVERVAVPEPGPHDVLVRVLASAVNHVDTFVRSGAYHTPVTFPFVVGRDLVGVVASVGDEVAGVAPGDAVWCGSLGHGGRQGAAAEFAIVPEERLYRAPDGVDPVRLVATVHPAATAWLGLVTHGGMRAGETVVVGGGAGNVGACAVAFALAAGCRVVASCGARDLPALAARGAVALDYAAPGLDDRLSAALPRGADVWFDTSGTLRLAQAVPRLADRGRLVLIAGMGRRDELAFGELYPHDRSIVGFAISAATAAELAEAARAIDAAIVAGTLPCLPVETLPLESAGEAHAALEDGSVRGRRLVLTP